MNLLFRPRVWEHFQFWHGGSRTMLKRTNALIKQCLRQPIGKPEPLKGDLAPCWSRRIDRAHRLVYQIQGDDLEILSCRFHFSS